MYGIRQEKIDFGHSRDLKGYQKEPESRDEAPLN